MKKVFKYGTGQEIPEGAVYLSTITEDVIRTEKDLNYKGEENGDTLQRIEKRLVWHYFLVEYKKATKMPDGSTVYEF